MAGRNRDPKVVWHAPTQKWIVVLFLEGNAFRFMSSPDLKTWTTLQDIVVPGCAECPDFFEIGIDGEPGVTRWVWTAANDHYLIGAFDGKRFTPEYMTNNGVAGGNYYAVQTYSGLANGRRVQLSWMKGAEYPQMPFNQQMSFPYELKLRRFGMSLKLCSLPVREIESIQHEPKTWSSLDLKPGDNPFAGLAGELWDIQTEFEAGEAGEVGFNFRGHNVTYTARKAGSGNLSNGSVSAEISAVNKLVKLRILVDRTTVEVFANDGEVVMPVCFVPKDGDRGLSMSAASGTARVASLKAYQLKSAWTPANG
jgi:sucrose-6-phosphate hydrolase SacC (GH32 family)